MGDDNRDIGGIVRSCNINRPNNVVPPNLCLKASPNDVWSSSDKFLALDLTSFNGLSKKSVRLTYELLQEELKNDIWTWRKYGQKHIKGSLFLRNYYKCSTSKHYEAKKQIEKSPKDENIFLVSCSGEHNHDPPMNRRYLASCNINSKFKLPKGINIFPKASILNASSSSSKHVKHSRVVASPIIATKPPLEIGSKNKMVVASCRAKVMVKKRWT